MLVCLQNPTITSKIRALIHPPLIKRWANADDRQTHPPTPAPVDGDPSHMGAFIVCIQISLPRRETWVENCRLPQLHHMVT